MQTFIKGEMLQAIDYETGYKANSSALPILFITLHWCQYCSIVMNQGVHKSTEA